MSALATAQDVPFPLFTPLVTSSSPVGSGGLLASVRSQQSTFYALPAESLSMAEIKQKGHYETRFRKLAVI
ncbi:uncharacterized protein LAESUDRAFT_186351 [Laetiporus sulphureus 93-53]|uniref:Uncharacterized protein n=1 Tax=Laetiporus sulphureus 93-53 TaxID=1314785 RepID=A0A165E552_9APHY|nr:uncharacterized protein LAESUDRAFT_186351 [Laetiporus sulphureus 93-53]KZT06255.1 hypothetical protein LAESUDRAFT_186351 [Laetiporus sulphureus 93-53]